jgi:hypothetical protein
LFISLVICARFQARAAPLGDDIIYSYKQSA